MKDPILNRLHCISLPEDGGYLPTPADLDTSLRLRNRQKYIATLNGQNCFWPTGCVDASSSHPLLITETHQETFERLAEALDLALQDIVQRWWTDKEASFPLRMPLEPQEEDLLRWINDNQNICRPYDERKGSWRPDFVIEHDETGAENFRICEINARFCWNGSMMIRCGQKALSTFNIESRGLIPGTDPDAITRGLLSLFNPSKRLHLVKGQEHGYDIFMFMEFANKLGLDLRLVHPDDLRVVPDQAGVDGLKLCCLVPSDDPDSFSIASGETVEDVHQICLELHQREFRALGWEMQKQISLRCFNDMRTILLVHDKRMLGIIREELGSLTSRGVISVGQARCLDKGIAHTILPGSSRLSIFEQDCRLSETLKDDYLLKPTRGGKGSGILFGDEINNHDWLAILQTMKSPHLNKNETAYVVQLNICQPFYNIVSGSDASPSRCRMVGTFHMAHGTFLGLGIWRCSPGRLCAISTGGASWMVSVMTQQDSS